MPIDSGNLALKGLDDLFSTEENRQEEQREQVQQIPIDASLTTLCPICLDSFQGAKGVRVRRADPKQKIKDVCTYCQIRYGFDYYVQPDKNAGQYVKRGHFDDESECA